MRPGPLLTEYASKEYGQGLRCLSHFPSGDPGRGGEHGEKSPGVLKGCQVKLPAGQARGEPACPDEIPLYACLGRPRMPRALPNDASPGTRQQPCYTARSPTISTPQPVPSNQLLDAQRRYGELHAPIKYGTFYGTSLSTMKGAYHAESSSNRRCQTPL